MGLRLSSRHNVLERQFVGVLGDAAGGGRELHSVAVAGGCERVAPGLMLAGALSAAGKIWSDGHAHV